MRRRIGVDLDNTLCMGQHWETEQQCAAAYPLPEAIEMVNKLCINDFVIIYTARQNWLMNVTFDWLEKNNVHYHALSNKKIPLDMLIDDIAVLPADYRQRNP